MTRKILARDSGVSERYLAQLEGGQGNVSILLLRDIAQGARHSAGGPAARRPRTARRPGARDRISAPPARLRSCCKRGNCWSQHFGGVDQAARRDRIALIGLRGAGKSTLGAKLAEQLDVPFLELDRLIEQEAGVSLGVIFDLYGQSGFRRLERRCLDEVIERYSAVRAGNRRRPGIGAGDLRAPAARRVTPCG